MGGFFNVKTLFVLEVLAFVLTFGYLKERLDQKAKVSFKIYVTDCTTNNYNTHIA